jgi:DNA-binding HxlR family transcriptional regulator
VVSCLTQPTLVRVSCITQLVVYNSRIPTRKSLDHLNCSVANAAELIGDRWTVLILRDAFLGVRRFDDFQKDLKISRNVLTERLAMLVETGIFSTDLYQERPPRFEYRLAEKGRDLYDILVTMWRWGDKWNPPADSFRRTLVHVDCGSETLGVIRCEDCNGDLNTRNTRVQPPLAMVVERRAHAET